MVYNFPYLKNSSFLKQFDKIHLKQQFVKLTVLDFKEKPIATIEGKVISGNFSLDGSSAMRRTGNINLIVDDYVNDLTTTKNLLSINKKIQVLIGFTNNTNNYNEYPIIWFPQGIYAIIAASVSQSSNGININLTLHDKMAFLNGECGGTLPASIILNEVDDIDEDGNEYIRQPTIFEIIQQLVNHFGGEQLGKIIISDLNNKAKKIMKWIGSTPLYYYQDNGNNIYTTIFPDIETYTTFTYGNSIGYILTDLVYPGQLISQAGETITSILDKIKNILGNYQYFYDINGNFVFQQIKNYLNRSYSTVLIDQINNNDYIVDYTGGKAIYSFEDSEILTAVSHTPQYQQIKNDFVIWGKRKTLNGKEIPIRYHLAIDQKPKIGNSYQVFFYIDPDDETEKAIKPIQFYSYENFPTTGTIGNYYLANNSWNGYSAGIYRWNNQLKQYELTDYTIETVTSTDYRTELYLDGVNGQPLGLASNYYYTELKNEWTKIYDIHNGDFFPDIKQQPEGVNFFLDFIDSEDAINEFSVNNIGRRSVVISDDSINCIFAPVSPDVVIIQRGTPDTETIKNECEAQHQQYSQVDRGIYSMLWESGNTVKSAYDEIKKELYQYTSYNEQVSLTTLPIYYLQPNTRITIRNSTTGIYGDYIIKTISMPLGINETMNISCTKALQRL